MSEYRESVITPLSRPAGSAWWTTGKKNSRMSALGATIIVVALALITWLVWMSPTDNVVRKVVGDVVKPISTNMELKNDRADLLTQLVSTKSRINDQSAELAKLKTELAAATGKSTALETKLSKAMATSSKSAGQVKDLKSQMASSGSSASGTAGSGTSNAASSGSTTPTTTTGDTPGAPSGGTTTTPTSPIVTGPTIPTTPSLASIKKPTSKYFGLYTQQSPFNWAENDDVSSKVGVSPNMSGYFQGFDSDFRADAVQRSWAKGQLPFLTWETQPLKAANNLNTQPDYALSKIIGGDYDAYLTKYAKAVAANKQPLAIRLDQEMNADWYPWGENTNGNSKGQFVQMWDHVHQIFADNGANDYVVWVWSPNRVDNLNSTQSQQAYLANYYPGPDEVDWVGMSGYLRPPYSNSETYSFQHTFQNTLTQLRAIAPDKPIVLSEIGASENGGQKAKWITDLFTNLDAPVNSDIIGFGWFNHTVTSTTNGTQYTNDWRIDSSGSSITAFTNGIATVQDQYKLKPTG